MLRLVVTCTASLSLLVSPVSALANTRAGDSQAHYSLPASVQAGTFPQSSWLIPDGDEAASLWVWLAGGTAFFLLLSAVVSNEPSRDRAPDPNHSNGAN